MGSMHAFREMRRGQRCAAASTFARSGGRCPCGPLRAEGLATLRRVSSQVWLPRSDSVRPCVRRSASSGIRVEPCLGTRRPDVPSELDRVWIVECAYVDTQLTGPPLECDGDAGAASWAELHSQPSSARVRPVGIPCHRPTRDFDAAVEEIRDLGKRATGPALAERAVAGVCSRWLSRARGSAPNRTRNHLHGTRALRERNKPYQRWSSAASAGLPATVRWKAGLERHCATRAAVPQGLHATEPTLQALHR